MAEQQTKRGQSDAVRQVALREYIEPARHHMRRVAILQGELKAKIMKLGFPARNANQIGTSIEADKFLKENGIILRSPKGQSRRNTTVYEFEFVELDSDHVSRSDQQSESHSERASRLVGKLLGLMKDEIAAHGGAEGYMRWVRDDEASSE